MARPKPAGGVKRSRTRVRRVLAAPDPGPHAQPQAHAHRPSVRNSTNQQLSTPRPLCTARLQSARTASRRLSVKPRSLAVHLWGFQASEPLDALFLHLLLPPREGRRSEEAGLPRVDSLHFCLPPSRGAAPLLLGEEVRLSNLLDRQTGLQELAQHKMATPSRRPLTFLLRTFLAHLSFTKSAKKVMAGENIIT